LVMKCGMNSVPGYFKTIVGWWTFKLIEAAPQQSTWTALISGTFYVHSLLMVSQFYALIKRFGCRRNDNAHVQ
jgi:steroid 5-alpha reductase family enzyme